MEGFDGSTIRCLKADSHPITNGSRLTIRGLENKERWFVYTPDRTVVAQVSETLQANFTQDFIVKRTGFLQILGANSNVSKYRHLYLRLLGVMKKGVL
ncbi:hypothetical protein D3C84_857770 [compost metagenome]